MHFFDPLPLPQSLPLPRPPLALDETMLLPSRAWAYELEVAAHPWSSV